LRARDDRDMNRSASPLKPAADAKTLDTSGLSIDQAVEQIIGWYSEVRV
jgi:cytidylate kinase